MASGWWLLLTPLKNMSSSVGMMTFPIYGKKHVPNHQPVFLFWGCHNDTLEERVELCGYCQIFLSFQVVGV